MDSRATAKVADWKDVSDWQPVEANDWKPVASQSPIAKDQRPAFKEPEGSALGRLAEGAWNTTVGGIGHSAKLLMDAARSATTGNISPETAEAIGGLVQSHADQARKMKEAWDRGDHSEALGHALATVTPIVGPAAAHAAEKMGGEAPQFDKYGNVTQQGQAPDIAGGIGEAAGLIVSSSPKNIAAPIARGLGAVASKIPVPERLTPEGMYQSSLRPSLAKKNLPKVKGQVATGLREGIPVSRGGYEEIGARIEDLNQEIADKLGATSDKLGPVVSPKSVAARVRSVEPTFSEQVNPNADMSALARSKQEFLDKHTTNAPFTKVRPGTGEAEGSMVPEGQGSTPIEKPLTLSEAQAEKQGTYRQLRKKFGELGSADVEAQKSLARGLKEEIMARVPELAGLNARDGALIELESQLQKMVVREGNKNILGLVPATMAHNPFGFLATLMMDNPAIKSRIAIALDRARKVTPSLPNPGALAPAAIPGAVSDQQDELPHYAKGGIAGLNGPEIALVGEEGPEQITPLSANLPTVPEAPSTIAEQVHQLSSGKRRVVMLPKGTPMLSTYQDKHGNQYVFNPNMISRNAIHAAAQTNNLTKILGASHGGMGAPDKSKLRGGVKAVVGKSASGITTQATATDRGHLRSALKQTRKVTPIGGRVSVTSPAAAVGERLLPPGPVR